MKQIKEITLITGKKTLIEIEDPFNVNSIVYKKCYFCNEEEDRETMFYSNYLHDYICNTCFEEHPDRDLFINLNNQYIEA